MLTLGIARWQAT